MKPYGESPDDSGRAYLNRLLSERNQHPDRIAEIDRRVREAFERKVAILALDMCGFSRLSVEYGIIHYLAMIYQMEQAARPAVLANGGQVIKQAADNLFAVFSDPASALEAALDIFRAFEAINSVVPDHRDIFGSIGIGYGNALVIGDEDLFGEEMNFACKLGEDVAEKMDVLLTPAAYEAMPEGRYSFATAEFYISDMRIRCYRYERSLHSQSSAE
jgi:class 3 adenylate cyclase